MQLTWLLVVPLGLALTAHATGSLFAKLGVALSCALMLCWAFRGPRGRGRKASWVVAALCLSAAGDWFLSNRGGRESYFIAGIALFFGAHVGFLNYAWRRGHLDRWVLGGLCVLYLPYYIFWLRPAIRSPLLAVAVLLYLLISCLAFAVACGLRLRLAVKWPFVAGIGLILFSDTLISFKEFLRWGYGSWWILPTYYLAHLCITWSLLADSCERQATSEPTFLNAQAPKLDLSRTTPP